MLNIAIQGQAVTGSYDDYAPFPGGVYDAHISEAQIENKLSSPTSKHPNMPISILKLKFDVYGASKDGGSRPYWENIVVSHEATQNDANMRGFVEKNTQKVVDLVLQVIQVSHQGNAGNSPFISGLTEQNVDSLVGTDVKLEFSIKTEKATNEKRNEVKSFFPADAIAKSAPMQQTQMQQQAPQVQQQSQQQQPQQQQNAQQAPQGNMPPFMQQQYQQNS